MTRAEMDMRLITEVQNRELYGIGWGPTEASEHDGLTPWVTPPAGFESFDAQGVVALVNPPAAGATAIILTFTVPQGFDGVIKRISHNTAFGGFVNGSGDIRWRILVGGVAARNYNNMLSEMGSQQIPRNIAGIRVFNGQVVQYQVTHLANAALNGNIVATVGGWFYPRRGQ